MAVVTLTTDFGTADPYAASMKGVILDIAPHATVVDVSHGVPPRNTLAGSLMLDAVVDCFPDGTVHVGVVDPGVGGGRLPIAVRTDRCWLVGPDNGLFTSVLSRHAVREAVHLNNPDFHRQPVSRTFHGRDIFAPVAAHLANGTPLHQMGDPLTQPMFLGIPQPQPTPAGLSLHVLHIDRFGNLVTDLTFNYYRNWQAQSPDLDPTVSIRVGSRLIHTISRTYSDVAPGELVAYFGSTDRLEIAVRDGHAGQTLGIQQGAAIHLERLI